MSEMFAETVVVSLTHISWDERSARLEQFDIPAAYWRGVYGLLFEQFNTGSTVGAVASRLH